MSESLVRTPRGATVPLRAGSAQLTSLIEQIDAGVLQRDRDNRAPFAEFALVKQALLGALRLPEPIGGGASLTELFEVVIDLGAADPNVAHSLRNHYQFVESRIRTAAQRSADTWLDKAAEGQLFGLAATELSKAAAGRRNQTFFTILRRAGDNYRLDGTKFYSTGNLYADWLVVSAQDEQGTPVRLIVPADRAGVVLERDWDGIGQRFTGSGTTTFVDVLVNPDELLYDAQPWPTEGGYLATFPQLYLTAVIAGILHRITRDAAALVRTKERTFYHAAADSPVEDPILQQSVGYIASSASVARAAVLDAATALERATDADAEGRSDPALSHLAALRAAQAKVIVDDLALRAASSSLFDVGGGSAVRQSAQLDRHWRNIRTLASHNPSTYKAASIGRYEINRTPLPNGAFF